MSQYYPQQPPSFPPPRPPEDVYYEDDYDEYDYDDEEGGDDNPAIRYAIGFFAGGCLVFLCMSCCFFLAGSLWMLDSSLGTSTPAPGSDIGLTYEDPAFIGESVVNDQNVQLTVRDVNRNVTLPTLTPNPEQEIIVITVDLDNLNTDQDITYNQADFFLVKPTNEAYPTYSDTSVVDQPLGRGKLTAEQGLSARLVFEVFAGEPQLILEWAPPDSTSRFIIIQ